MMYKKLIIIALMITQWSWGGQIQVKLPGSDETQTRELTDEIIDQLKILKPRGAVSKKPMEAIGDTIDPNSNAGRDVMSLVGEYLDPTEIKDLGLIQTILTAADLQIGQIKECVDESATIDDETDRQVIKSKITYYDYSISIDASGILNIQREEKQLKLTRTFEENEVMCNFDNKNNITIRCECIATDGQQTQDFLQSKNTFSIWYPYNITNDCIGMSLSFAGKELHGSYQPLINKQGNTDQYTVLQTIALIIKAASMVKASKYEDFVEPFTKNLASFDHPQILCTT